MCVRSETAPPRFSRFFNGRNESLYNIWVLLDDSSESSTGYVQGERADLAERAYPDFAKQVMDRE